MKPPEDQALDLMEVMVAAHNHGDAALVDRAADALAGLCVRHGLDLDELTARLRARADAGALHRTIYVRRVNGLPVAAEVADA